MGETLGGVRKKAIGKKKDVRKREKRKRNLWGGRESGRREGKSWVQMGIL
jgi:hypothetical protein